jgi:hypothetical protein
VTAREGRAGGASHLLEGNGAGFLRERALAAAVQHALERVYQLERTAGVGDFLHPANDGEREGLLVRDAGDGTIEMRLHVPALARREFDVEKDADLDPLCQLIEGVSHFVYLAERARADREATQLELELQAEIDKYVVLAGTVKTTFDVGVSEKLRARLYEMVAYEHDEATDAGERYRVANDLANRYVRHLEREYVAHKRFGDLRSELRRFYRLGQEEKLRASRAA